MDDDRFQLRNLRVYSQHCLIRKKVLPQLKVKNSKERAKDEEVAAN